MYIDIQLKSLIEEKNITPNQSEKNDVSAWVMNKWVPFCFECLQNETLFESFKSLLGEKIAEEGKTENFFSSVSSSQFTKEFFMHLLMGCNKEYAWFDLSRMNVSNFSDFMWRKINKNHSDVCEGIEDKLDQYYKLAIAEWLNKKMNVVNLEDKHRFYMNAFKVYCEACLVNLFGTEKQLQKMIAHLLNTTMSNSDNVLTIIQNNNQIIGQSFLQFLSTNEISCVGQLDLIHDAHIVNEVIESDVDDHFKQVIQSKYNYALKEYLLRITNEKHTKNELNISLAFVQSGVRNHFMDFIPELVVKDVYKKITFIHQNVTIFSYDRQRGVQLNCDFIDNATADRVDAVNDMLENKALLQELSHKKQQMTYGFSSLNSSDISYDIHKYVNDVADKSVSKTAHDFTIDQYSPVYKIGKSGLKAYLAKLDQQYTQLLMSNAIDKGYELVLAGKFLTHISSQLKISIIRGMVSYFKGMLTKSSDYIFSCQKIIISLGKEQIDDEYADELCQLIRYFDKAKVAECYFNLENLEISQFQKLHDTLLQINYTHIRFNVINSFEQSCQLEAVNDEKKQIAVAYYEADALKQISYKNEIASQPTPITRLKLKALLDKVVELKPVNSKIGIQNQHQYEAEVQEQVEIEIKQSWQITEAKQVQKENVYRHDHINGEEVSSLISWSQIEAAVNPNHSNHEAACNKLGKEIVEYQYKNRNLKDLWERLTGNIEVTEQNNQRVYEPKYEWLRYYSQYIPKQISYKTLLTIVRHPHAFQDGLNLHSIPDSFGYDAQNGALYTKHGKEVISSIEDKPNPYVIKINEIAKGNQPSAEHITALIKSDIPSRAFYQSLGLFVTPYQAWHAWRKAFHSLNLFNIDGIEAINKVVQQEFHNAKHDNQIMLDYIASALNHYCYLKSTRQVTEVKTDRIQFEYDQNEAYKKGDTCSLSPEHINLLDITWRDHIHESISGVVNRDDLLVTSNKDNVEVYKQLLMTIMSYHLNKLPRLSQTKFLSLQEVVFKLYDSLGVVNLIKVLELSLSHDKSAIYSFALMLHELHRVYGEKGVQDFNNCFISPAINISSLVNLQSQNALTQLLTLSPIEYHWWEQLTMQHLENSGYGEFALAMNAFQYFLGELDQLGVRHLLLMPCPVQGIANIQVGLERVIQVLKKVKNPSEQMRNLAGMDWGASGVVYALPQVDYNFITQDMKLNSLEDIALKNTLRKNENYFHEKSYHHYGVSSSDLWMRDHVEYNSDYFNAILTCFYRYIGCHQFVAPLQVYKQLLDAIKLPVEYTLVHNINSICRVNNILTTTIKRVDDAQNLVLTNLLKVIAYSTTGQRALDSLPGTEKERALMVNDFIAAVYECSLHKYPDKEMQTQLDAIHAISESNVREVLFFCADLSKGKDGYSKEDKFRLTMKELTAILRLITLSIKATDKLNHDEHELMIKSSPQVKELEFEKITTCYTQLSRTRELLTQYGYYLTEGLTRISKYNTGIDYASFASACVYLNTANISFENKSRLLRIFSLIPFKRHTFYTDAHHVIDLLKLVIDSQNKITGELLDKFISILSSIIPYKHNNHFAISGLIELTKLYVSKTQQDETFDVNAFILSYYKNFKIDPDVSDIKDVDFYQDQYELEQKYPNLGVYYNQIKTIVFKRYPVAFGENKKQAWEDFIGLLQRLEHKLVQNMTLQMLLDAPQQIDLTTLNKWLVPLLSNIKDKFRAKFKPEYFYALQTSLLTHHNNNEFVKILNDWFNYTDWFSIQDHMGFINILNKIADVDNERINLEPIYYITRNIAAISTRDQFPWYEKISRLMTLLAEKHKEINLNDIFKSLSGFFKQNEENYNYTDSFKILIRLWLANIESSIDFTLKLPQRWNPDNAVRSYKQLFVLAHLTQFDQDRAWHYLVQLGDDEIKKLVEVYESQPAPSTPLFAKLVNNEFDVSTFCLQYISDPHHERTEDKLKQQFDDDILWQYINRAKYINQNESSLRHFSSQLTEQLKFANHVGRSEFRFLSSKEIGNRLYECRKLLALADNNDKKFTVYLTAFALIREAVYKTSHLWPTPIQVLAVFSALNHQLQSNANSPLFMQMATGEGKSLLAVFFALLTWLNGNPVTVVTHRASLALRDVNTYASLFKSLNIECEHLTAEGYKARHFWRQWSKKSAEFDGVYYAEFNDIVLIKQQRLLDEGQDIDNMSFIIDEADEIILHNQLDNNLSQAIGDAETHQHAWVFLAIAAYLEKTDSKNVTLNIRIADLVGFICEEFPLAANVSQDPEFLAMLPSYINAAWYARTLTEKNDFIPKKHDKRDEYYAAVIINDKAMSSNVTFNGLIHQALHGRLNYESTLLKSFKRFHVAPETRLFSSMSPEAGLRWMVQSKCLIALSATKGSNAECMEMQQHFGFQFIKLPKMQGSLRQDYPKQICKNHSEQMRTISEICQRYIDNRTPAHARAILIVVDSIDKAEKVNAYLLEVNAYYNVSMMHAGIDTISDATLGEVELQAGQMGRILIATSGSTSRGFDIKLSTAKQLVGITTYFKNEADEIQVKGRVSRVNQMTGLRDKGKFYAVYDLEAELSRYPDNQNNRDGIFKNPEAFKQQQYFSYYKQESASRLYKQLMSVTKNTIQTHFYSLWVSFFKGELVPKPMRSKIMSLFTETLECMSNAIPLYDFNSDSNAGVISRNHYNMHLLTAYQELLNKFTFIVDKVIPSDITAIISGLINIIESGQFKLLKQHALILQAGSDQPAISPGKWIQKQNMGDYVFNMFSSFMQSNNTVEPYDKLTKLKTKRFNFIDQMQLIMNMDQSKQNVFSMYLSHYEEMQKQDTYQNRVPVFKNIVMREIVCIQHQFGSGQNMIFVHEPLIDMSSQIHLTANSLGIFKQVQDAIRHAYEVLGINQPLQFRVSKEASQYKIVIDFSGHPFDCVDRKLIFSMIAKPYAIVTDQLFENQYYPSLKVMKSIVNEIREMLIHDMGVIPDALLLYFRHDKTSNSRMSYSNYVYNLLFKRIEDLHDSISIPLQKVVKALLRSSHVIEYTNQKGIPCVAVAPSFTNLAELMEIDKKRQIISLINSRVVEFNKSTMKDALLCKFQKDCLIQLGCEIVCSKGNHALFDIYEKWLHKKIQYMQESIAIVDLMNLRKNETSYLFGASSSPKVSTICEEIDQLRRDDVSLETSKVINYK